MTANFTNRLAAEKSPYLLQHAHNPVDWLPWGEAAFAKARAEGKPIFLSIGYSTCHWCHVMAHESFENPGIAEIMNRHFVCVKVDREERPDVDKVYMSFVQATTGGGGWPMSVWLTPDLKPFLGGTYFPPEDRYGRPGFPTVLAKIAEVWEKDRARITEQGEQMVEALREHAAPAPGGAIDPGRETLRGASEQIGRMFDSEYGGFGGAPKFPRPATLNFLLRYHALEGGKDALEMSLQTLRKMADGGMHDHLGGGFHRYSVDRYWHIPHFEKMLYDQAQLAMAYLDAFQITHDPFYENVARDVLDYVRRDMTAPSGGFYSAEDADSLFEHGKPGHGEGAFYVWTKEEIDRALGADAEFFNRVYGVEAEGNAPEGSDPQGEFEWKNTLIQRMPPADEKTAAILEACRQKLFAIREKRPRPHLDDKIITAWNGLMISAFARGHAVLDDAAYLDAARNAARFVKSKLLRDDGTLARSYREGVGNVPGFADDYAFLIQGLLDLYEASAERQWLDWAMELQRKMDTLFADDAGGGWFSTRAGEPDILIRMKEDYDGAEPSPNSIGALNLLRLAQMTGDETLRARAVKAIGAFSLQLQRMPSSMPQMLVAFLFDIAAPRQIVIAGNPGAPDALELLREVNEHFIPDKVILFSDAAPQAGFLRTLLPVDGSATAYVCENFACNLPVTDADALRKILLRPK